MNKKKSLLSILVLILLVIFLYSFFYYKNVNIDTSKPEPTNNSDVSQNFTLDKYAFKDYTNKIYGYNVKYSNEVNIDTFNVYSKDIREEREVSFGIPGETTILSVNVFIDDISKKDDLEKYAKEFHKLQTDFRDSYNDRNPKIVVSDISKTLIDQKVFYVYAANGGVQLPDGGGYATGDGEYYKYYITENSNGEKMLISYLVSSVKNFKRLELAKYMFDSFQFLDINNKDIK